MSVTKVTGMMSTGTKGGDIPSASTLVIDTDGDYFDITGTTGITAMTVDAGRRFTLHFDGALTLTHGSSLYLPGATNFTTEANDCLSFIATAANTVRCTGYALKDGGSPVAPSGGAWAVKNSGTFSSVASVEFTGLSKTTRIVITSLNQTGASGNAFYTSTDNGSSYDTGGSDYSFVQTQIHTDLADGSSTVYNRIKNAMGQGAILPSFSTGGGANTASFDITIYDPANTSEYTAMSWEHIGRYSDGTNKGINSVKGATFRNSTGNVDAFKYSAGSGNFAGSYITLELN